MGLSCRCQELPKGGHGRPCEKCKARAAKRAANGALRKAVQKYQSKAGQPAEEEDSD